MHMFKKKPTLQYKSAIESLPNLITPAKSHVPDWYKKIPKWKNNKMFQLDSLDNHTLKMCVPFLDALTVGYMVTLPMDVYVELDENKNPNIFSRDKTGFVPVSRSKTGMDNPILEKNNPQEFVWRFGVCFSIPTGYSMLITHPLNRNDLPFTTYSGIVDGGFVMQPDGNIPFNLKQDFQGIIKKGTPIAQIIPFLQQNWKSTEEQELRQKSYLHHLDSFSMIFGWYKKTFWVKKNYQ